MGVFEVVLTILVVLGVMFAFAYAIGAVIKKADIEAGEREEE